MAQDQRPTEIKFDAVDLEIEGRKVLSAVTFETRARRVGVIGRNGSGKTSLSRLLSGLLAPNGGRVQIDGCDPAKDRRAALTLVGILFQNPDHQIIFPTVIEELAFGLRQMGNPAPEAEAARVLDQFDKAHWRDAAVHSLSQGQKKLVCLMAVLAMAPRVLVLDEPFAGLDIPTRLQLNRYLDRYEGTLVHVSHDPADLEGYEQLIWLEQGRLHQQGAAAEILDGFAQEMARQGASDDISDLAH